VVLLVNPHLGGDIEEAGLRATRPQWLLFASLAVAVYLLADGFTLAFLVRAQLPQLPLRRSLRIALESNLVAGATSFGGLELPYQVMLLRRLGLNLAQISSSLAFKALLHISILVLVAAGTLLPVVPAPFTPNQRLIITVVLALLLAAWCLGVFWLKRPWGLSRLPAPIGRQVARLLETGVVIRRAGWRILVPVVALQILYWLAVLAIVPLVLLGLGWKTDLGETVTRQAALHVLMPFSPLPGGAGVAELGYLELIGSSLPAGVRVSSLLIWRALTWVAPMVIGAILLGLRTARAAEEGVGAVVNGRTGG
jgi:uncharacterized membrane protein YbhN (UPF0104 family)